MTEKAEASALLANILRTTPYTAYLASFAVGVLYHTDGLVLCAALLANEVRVGALSEGDAP